MGRFIPNLNTYVGFTTTAPGLVAAPTAPTGIGSGTGGTLAAATYAYKVTALVGSGETAASAASTGVTTTGTTSKVTLTLTEVTGATGYRIYGRTGAAFLFLAEVPAGTTTFVDTGAVTPSGAAPSVGTAALLAAPAVADVTGCIDLTHWVTGLNASATGSAVQTPAFDTKFETNIDGTAQGTFTADMYRDDTHDLAWSTLPRGTKGYFLISRYGGRPDTVGAPCEVWPVTVLSRAVANMSNNQTVMFNLTCAVPDAPAEDAVTVA